MLTHVPSVAFCRREPPQEDSKGSCSPALIDAGSRLRRWQRAPVHAGSHLQAPLTQAPLSWQSALFLQGPLGNGGGGAGGGGGGVPGCI